jgi:hypothetical protein
VPGAARSGAGRALRSAFVNLLRLLAAEVKVVSLASFKHKAGMGRIYACCVRCSSKSFSSVWSAVTFVLKFRSSLWFVFGF